MLTFPPGVFAESSTAFPEIFRGNGVVALNKPSGIAVSRRPRDGGRAVLCGELRRRIADGSASALALGIAQPDEVLPLDADCSGATLIADRAGGALAAWRNAVGSGLLIFRFVFLTKPARGNGNGVPAKKFSADAPAADAPFDCTLPLAPHFSEPRAVVSHKTGKKSATRFLRTETFGEFALFCAETRFPRLHQIRVHAAECGIPVVGDVLYGGAEPVPNSVFCRKGRLNKGEERPIYAALCLHLAEIVVPAGALAAEAVTISAPLPDGFAALLKKFRALRCRV